MLEMQYTRIVRISDGRRMQTMRARLLLGLRCGRWCGETTQPFTHLMCHSVSQLPRTYSYSTSMRAFTGVWRDAVQLRL